MSRRLLPILLQAVSLSACGGQPALNSSQSAPEVLTSTPWLAECADPHSYQPTPQDAARMSGSKLIIVNGAGYEQFLKSLLENAGSKTTVVEASTGISPSEEAGSVIKSFSSDASPSTQQLAALVDQVRSSGAPAIFLDTADSDTFAKQIARETGVRVVTSLHLESLTDGPPASTYIDMMKYNVTQIVNALK